MVLESSVLMMSECVKISQRKSIVLRQIRNALKNQKTYRSICLDLFCEKGVPKSFTKCRGRYLYEQPSVL